MSSFTRVTALVLASMATAGAVDGQTPSAQKETSGTIYSRPFENAIKAMMPRLTLPPKPAHTYASYLLAPLHEFGAASKQVMTRPLHDGPSLLSRVAKKLGMHTCHDELISGKETSGKHTWEFGFKNRSYWTLTQ